MTTKNYNKLEDKNTLYNLKSTTDGLTVVKSQENGEEVFTINADVAFQKHYTKGEVDKAIAENNKKAQTLTKYNGRFNVPNIFNYDNRPPVLSHNPVNSFGIFKVDGFVRGTAGHSAVIAELPAGAPIPIEFLEIQQYIGNEPISFWLDRGGKVRSTGLTQAMIGKRFIINFVGLYA